MLSDSIGTPITVDNSLFQKIKWYVGSNIGLVFKGSCLKQGTTTFTPQNLVNLFVAYKLDTWSRDLNSGFTLKDFCLELLS